MLMKNNFQSKAVPRGTRTIWRYLSALILLFSLSIGQMWGADPQDTYYKFTATASAGATIAPVSGDGGNITLGSNSAAKITAQNAWYTGVTYTHAININNTDAKSFSLNISGTEENPAHVFVLVTSDNRVLKLKYDGADVDQCSVRGTAGVSSYTAAASLVELVTTNTGSHVVYASGSAFVYAVRVVYEKNDLWQEIKGLSDATLDKDKTLADDLSTLYFFRMQDLCFNTDGVISFGNTVSTLRYSINFKAQKAGTVTINYANPGGSTRTLKVTEFTRPSTAGTGLVSKNVASGTTSYSDQEFDVESGKEYVISFGSGATIKSVHFVAAAPKYDVVFANGGEGTGSMATLKYEAGEQVTLPACGYTPASGREFNGWTSSDVTISAGKFTMPSKNVTITATWRDEAVKYTVTYDVNGGSSATPTETDKAAGDEFALAAAPEYEGYHFEGWLCDADAVTYDAEDAYTMTAANTTFTAQWKPYSTISIANKTYIIGSGNFNAVSDFSSNCEAAVIYELKESYSGVTLTPTGVFSATAAGEYIVVANQAGDATYAATSKEFTVTVLDNELSDIYIWAKSADHGGDGKCVTSAQANQNVNANQASTTLDYSTLTMDGMSAMGRPASPSTVTLTFSVKDAYKSSFGITNVCAYGKIEEAGGLEYSWNNVDWTAVAGGESGNNKHEFTAPAGTFAENFYIRFTNAESGKGGLWFRNALATLEVKKTVTSVTEALVGAEINGEAISAANLAALLEDKTLDIATSYATAPTVTFVKQVTTSYAGGWPADVENVDVEVTASDNTTAWQASATINAQAYTINIAKPAGPSLETEATAFTLTSAKIATDTKNFTFSGVNLTAGNVTIGLESPVAGMTVSPTEVTPTAGVITDQEVTITYKSLEDVAEANVNLVVYYDTDTKIVLPLTYSSTAGVEDLTPISAATTWNWDGANSNTGEVESLDANNIIVLANHDGWVEAFKANSIAGKLQFVTRGGKYAQGHELKFNTTIPGRVTVTFSNTGGKDIARAPRITDVNGSYAPTDEADGSKNTTAMTYTHNVVAGDVLIAGFEMQTGTPANMLRYYKVEFVPTYTVAYAAGEHGSGTMTDANAYIAGEEVTLLPNTFAPESGYVWSGWVVTKTASGDPVSITDGKFNMPGEAVTVTAQWDDASKVVKIVETGVKYSSLAEAVAAATDGQTVQLLQDVDVTAQVEVAGKAITLDLAGHKIEYTGTETLPSGVILVHNGGSLTINDSSDPDAGSIVAGEKAYAAIALTKAGDDATNPAVLTINGGTFTGYYYAITGHGSRHNTTITINNGTFTATAANDNNVIYHPQEGTLTINNGTFTGYLSAIEMRAGTLVINNGTFTATASTYKCDPNGSGTTTQGAAIAIAQHNTQKPVSVTINGGTFNGVKAINEANPQGNPASAVEKIDIAIKGGDFTGAVTTEDVDHFISGGTFDAPVANENCATGWVPAPADPITGKYSVTPKDAASLIKAVATAVSQDITGEYLTGVFKGAAHINTGTSYKMDTKKYFMVQLVESQNFQAGDIVKINVSAVNDCNGFTIYSDIESDGDFDAANLIIDTHENSSTAAKVSAGINEVELPNTYLGSNKLYVARCNSCDKYLNAGINQVEVVRIQNPQLAAITIDGRDGVINEAAKTVAVTIPYDADLAALTVVPTIVWNAAAAENSIVVNDGAAWTEGANTYKLTDKDGDYTVYTITLTRDVQKFVVTYFDDETNLGTEEVEKNGHPTATGIVAPTKKGKIFLGWNQSSTATAAEDLNDITITEAKNLYAIYEDIDCSGTGVKFSMTPKANELTENYEPKGDEERDYAEYATLVGGKVFINNVDASNKRISVLKETSHIKFEGGDDGYIHVELDCPLNEKDTIKIENDQKWKVSVAKGSGYVAKAKADKYHVVPAAWDGKYDFYIKRDGSSLTISGIQVVRPAKYTVSFDMMGHGSAIAPITNVFDGTKITAPTAPTDANYSFAGWYKENTLANEWDFDNDVVVANTTLFAKWLDKSDATLKSLKYGDTEIALEDGVYTYNVNVSALVSGVPALTAVTNNPSAIAAVTDAAEFDGEGKATSTVEVTPEKEGAAHQTYTVKFTKLPLYTDIVDVTGYTEWSWAGVATAEVKINDVANRGVILANYIDAPNFEMLACQENARAYRNNSYPAYQGTYLKFHATVPGRLTIKARNSSGSPILRVNGIDLATLNGTQKDYITAVPEGDVEITSSADEFRIYAMTFDPAVDYTRDVTEGKYGTICLPTNGVMIGTTIYTLAYFGETSQKIFFDEVVTGRMEAGKPYLFLPEQGVTELKVFYTDSETKAAQAVNGFHGYIGDSEDPEDALQVEAGVGNYIVQNNTYREVQAGATAYILSHRAYITFSEITSTEPAKAPGARRIGLGKDAAQGFENLQSGETPMKVMIDGTLYIIRGEKVYNANGQVVK